MKSVVLLSGGLDSVTLMHYVAKEKEEEIFPLFVAYGQPQLPMEMEAAQKVCNVLREQGYKVDGLEILEMTDLLYRENTTDEEIPQRNLIFISHAAKYAEQIGAEKIYIAVTDPCVPRRFIDTTPTFINAVNEVLKMSKLTLSAPFVYSTKDVVYYYYSKKYGIDIDDTWSCNYADESGKACGKCGNCEFRNRVADKFDNIGSII